MSFNYRVVREGEELAIHEVFYNDEGTPISYTIEALSPSCRTVDDLRYELELMLDSLQEPVLSVEEIGARGGK